jgi:cbb3-type cytochrome oxidase cytochrome c subunit
MNLKKCAVLALPALIAGGLFIAETLPGPAGAWELLPGEKPPTGEQIVLDLHCHTCHIMPGAEKHTLVAPGGLRVLPALDFEADRAREEWVFDFLKAPFHLRPELHAQMPDFALTDEEAMALTSFLMTLKLKKEVYVPEGMGEVIGVKDPDQLKLAKDTFDLYKCFQCHLLEGKVIDPEKGQSGPDFIHTYNRLKVPWNYQWLVDPQAFIPGTKMPNFFYSDDEELIDDPDADMHLILVYMYSLGEDKDYKEYRELKKKYSAVTTEQGRKLAEDLYCTGCHEFEGWDNLDLDEVNKKHDGRMDLTRVAGRRDKKWIRDHLAQKKPDQSEVLTGKRPGFQLNDYELKTLVDYIATLK